jgi:uncharacterized protein YqiB (DUF1249 family)
MQYPWISHTDKLLDSQPGVGRLLDLCEENYQLLLRLAPDLRQMQGTQASRLSCHMDLFLEVVEQTPYTTVIHLTYYFSNAKGQQADPDALLRVYHDARQIEVMRLRQNVLPVVAGYQYPSLLNKWKINVFLSKWLSFCCHQNHHFLQQGEFLTKSHG